MLGVPCYIHTETPSTESEIMSYKKIDALVNKLEKAIDAKQVPLSKFPMRSQAPQSNRVELPDGTWCTKEWTKEELRAYKRGVLGQAD